MATEQLDKELTELLGHDVEPGSWQLMHEDAEWEHFWRGTVAATRRYREPSGRSYWITVRRMPKRIFDALSSDWPLLGSLIFSYRFQGEEADASMFWVSEYGLHPEQYSTLAVPIHPGDDIETMMSSEERAAVLRAYDRREAGLLYEASFDEDLDDTLGYA